jgi:hypothetical protein
MLDRMQALKRAKTFVRKDRANLECVYAAAKGLVATDGYRLAVIPCDVGDWLDTVRDTRGGEERPYVVFPDYAQVFFTPKVTVDVDASALRKALGSKDSGVLLDTTYTPEPGFVMLQADVGQGKVDVGLVTARMPHPLVFTCGFVKDALVGAKGKVSVSFGQDCGHRIQMTREDGEIHVIQPRKDAWL